MSNLKINNLRAGIDGKEILKGVDLEINSGEIHALMGPNGSGKSTLASVFMGKSNLSVTAGEIALDGQNILEMSPEERSCAGLFLGFQNPMTVPGVTIMNLLRLARNTHEKLTGRPVTKINELANEIYKYLDQLGLPQDFAQRYINDGFSGGEKKRTEILQMMVIKPKIAVLDEIDSGVDIDAMRSYGQIVSDSVRDDKLGVLLITHYPRILRFIKPNSVHVFVDGRIVESGGLELAEKLEKNGYKDYLPQSGLKLMSGLKAVLRK